MGRKINVVATILAICLAFEVSAKEGRRPYMREASQEEVALLPAAMAGWLDDSHSAKFKDVRVLVTGYEGEAFPMCGKVSAKDGSGVYSHYAFFFGSSVQRPSGGREVTVLVADPAGRPGPAASTCSENGF